MTSLAFSDYLCFDGGNCETLDCSSTMGTLATLTLSLLETPFLSALEYIVLFRVPPAKDQLWLFEFRE